MTLRLQSPPLPLRADADGVVRVGGTRVTLDTVIAAFKRGATAEQIAHDYPVLDLADVYAAISFYLNRRDEVERYLAEQRREAEEVRARMEARFDPHGIRERLLARRSRKEGQDDSPAGG
ncbi:MAG TPA: DUF433 domain-containing protein [Gemmataceae bacterium]